MRNETRYCPQCVEEMKPEKKHLGKCTDWLKCPNCGLRERPRDELADKAIAYTHKDRHENKNKNQLYFKTVNE